MKRDRLLSALAMSLLTASAAHAVVLVPGSSAPLSGWVPAAGGTVLYDNISSFTAVGVPPGGTASTGKLEQTVTQMVSGELLFGLRIIELNAAPDITLTKVLVTGWGGFTVDTDFLINSGAASPALAERNGAWPDGAVVDWTDFGGNLRDGNDSSWLQILTTAPGFNATGGALVLNFSDGSRTQVVGAAPSLVPAPGALALIGLAALAGFRRRR